MLPVVVPLTSFRIFTSTILREKIPFSPKRTFSEFSSLVEILTLTEQVHFHNVGPFIFEWRTGSFDAPVPGILGSTLYNPYQPFHGVDFITAQPTSSHRSKEIIQLIPEINFNAVIDKHFGQEPRNELGL